MGQLKTITKQIFLTLVPNYQVTVSVEFYYNMFHMNHNKITFQTIQTNSILNFLKICDVIKAVGIDNVCGKFLKVGVNVLADIQTISFFKRLQCSKVEISVQKRD